MAWVTPTNVATGDVLTASKWNQDVVENWNALGGAWTAFTPTWGNVTLGTTGLQNNGAYMNAGSLYVVRFSLTLGTGGSFTGSAEMTLPNGASGNAGYDSITLFGTVGMVDGGSTGYLGHVRLKPGDFSKVSFLTWNVAGTHPFATGVNGTTPFTWAATDLISGQFMFEAA